MLYIFHGPNDFTRAEKIAELQASLGDTSLVDLNFTRLEGRDLTLGEIRHYADAMPFMASNRIVVLVNYTTQLKGKSDETERFLEYLEQLAPTTDLILVEDEPLHSRHPLLQAATALQAEVINFAGPDRNNLSSWIVKRVQTKQATIEPDAAHLLGRRVGPALRALNQEIEKLVLYTAGQRPIQQADVEKLVPYTEEAENFGLANALGQRNSHKAYDQLHKLLDEGSHPMSILASIAAQVRGLLEVKDMAERGWSPAEIAKMKGWRSDYAARMRLKEATNFSAARLEEILEILLETDLAIKTGRIDSLLAVDTLVARLCVL